MEELAGRFWHHFVTRQTCSDHTAASVDLAGLLQPLTLYYRALGGSPARQIAPADPRRMNIERTLAQRIAGTHGKLMLSWQDEQGVYLPPTIACFPKRELNEALYFWLAALSSRLPVVKHWVADNLQASAVLLHRYPGLVTIYRKLVDATITMETSTYHVNISEFDCKPELIELLQNPEDSNPGLTIANDHPVPVPLWFYPPPTREASVGVDDDPDSDQTMTRKVFRLPNIRKKASRVDDRKETDGLLVFQLESLFSWTEHVQLDRCQEENLDEDITSAAKDLDIITLSRQRKASGAKINFDLDLPSPQNDDLPVGDGIKLPEWNYKKQELVSDFCLLQPMLSDTSTPCALPEHLQHLAQRLIPHFSALQLTRRWHKRQPVGDDIDLDGWLDSVCEPVQSPERHTCYKAKTAQARDLACLLLADLSLSTDTLVSDGQRVIEVIRDTLLLFSEAMNHTKDRLAIYGFSSVKNKHIRYHLLKNFPEPYSDDTRGRIMAVRPGYYTRLGAAIRQSCNVLNQQGSEQRLLLIISDGKPNDIDQYEGRYGIEDTRHAVIEARQQGIIPFCITIDSDANTYLPYLFGHNGYAVVQDASRLPLLLPQLYLQLTTTNHHS